MTTEAQTLETPVDSRPPERDRTSSPPSVTQVATDVLRWLAVIPFLAQRELEVFTARSESAVYRALRGLRRRRLVDCVPVSTPGAATVPRWHLTPSGVEEFAKIDGVSVERALSDKPVSSHWIRLLAERMDALTPIYRLVTELARVTAIEAFRWYRGHPLDALVELDGGRLLGIMREGRSALPSHLGQRLRSLMHGRRPHTIVVLAPDSLRLRDWKRMMERMPISAFLVLEEDVMRAGDETVYHVPSDPDPWPLRRAVRLAGGGAVPTERRLSRVSPPPSDLEGHLRDIEDGRTRPSDSDHTLALSLDAGSKRVMDTLSLWPWASVTDLADMLGVSTSRTLKMLDRPLRLGLVTRIRHGRVRYVLGDRGLAFHARRDRLAVPMTLRRWSPSRSEPDSPLSWQDLRGSRTRQLARHMAHTSAVHSFMAAMSRQARETGILLAEAQPPHRAGRRYPTTTGYGAVNPDAYGRLESAHGHVLHFFLELERRAEWRGRFLEKLRPYLRYYASGQPLETFGEWPSVLFVFRDEIAEMGFLRASEGEAELYDVEEVLPLFTTTEGLVAKHGPLDAIWRLEPGGQRTTPWASEPEDPGVGRYSASRSERSS